MNVLSPPATHNRFGILEVWTKPLYHHLFEFFRAWPCLTCWSISFFVLMANWLPNWTFFTRPSSPSTKALPLWTVSLKDLVRLIFTKALVAASNLGIPTFSTGGIQTKFVKKNGLRKKWLQSWKFNSWRWKNRHLTTNQPGKPRHPPSLMMRASVLGRILGSWRDWRKDIDSAEFGGTVAFKMIQHAPSSSSSVYILEPKNICRIYPGCQDIRMLSDGSFGIPPT